MRYNYDRIKTTALSACQYDRLQVVLKDGGVSGAKFNDLGNGRVRVELSATDYPEPYEVDYDYFVDLLVIR